MKHLYLYIIFCLVGSLLIPGIIYGSRLDEIRAYSKKISEANQVNRLYSIRYGLGRMSNESGLTVDEKRELMIALKQLSSAFADRNHFRNAADVWFDYLAIQKAMVGEYDTYLRDSVAYNYGKIASSERSQLEKLNSELKKLKEQQEVIAGIRNKYYTFGGIAIGIILLVFGYLLFQQISNIREIHRQLVENKQTLQRLYRSSIESRMTGGGIAFVQSLALTGTSLLEEMGEQKPQDVPWDTFIKELKALSNYSEA